jgi:ring-1,2-phenylacetyl-CoA epoxidase subunit PaaA
MMFGPHDSESAHSAKSMKWKIKRETNDDLRQKFIDQTVPQIEFLGLEHPDKDIKWNEERGHYDSGEIDWEEFYNVINGNGYCNRQRIQHHVQAHEEGCWVRDAQNAYHEKLKQRLIKSAV